LVLGGRGQKGTKNPASAKNAYYWKKGTEGVTSYAKKRKRTEGGNFKPRIGKTALQGKNFQVDDGESLEGQK